MRACLATLFISALSLAAQFTMGGLSVSMGIMGTLQGIGTTAVVTGNNAVNNLPGMTGQSGSGVSGGAQINPLTGLPVANGTTTGGMGGMAGVGGGVQVNPQTGLPVTNGSSGGMGGAGGGVQINPLTGLPVTNGTPTNNSKPGSGTQGGPGSGLPGAGTTNTSKPGSGVVPGGGMGAGFPVNPVTGLPMGPGGARPSLTRPTVGPVATPVSVANVGSGKKFGPVMRMVSMTGFRGFSVNSRPKPNPSVNSSKGLTLSRNSVVARTVPTVKSRSVRPTGIRGGVSSSAGRAGRMFVRMRRTPGR